MNGKQRKNIFGTSHLLVLPTESQWFALWEMASEAALCDNARCQPRVCFLYRAVPLRCPLLVFLRGSARAHDLVEDCFSAEVSAELSACRCCPLSPPELDSTGRSPYRKPTLEQLCREGLHPLGAHELLNLIFHSFPSKERGSERAAGWVSSS